MIDFGDEDKSKYLSAKYIFWISFILGLIAQIIVYHFDYNYAYRDSIFRSEAARRFFDSTSPGIINQIGTVWLPLPNFIMMPLTNINILWYSGLAGAIVNFILYLFSSVFFFKILRNVTGNVISVWIGSLLFVTNINMLYFQTTYMTETIYIFFNILLLYCLTVWIKNKENKYLFFASLFTGCFVLTRYDAWPVFAVAAFFVVIISYKFKINFIKSFLIYSVFPALLIIWWFYHNYLFYGDMLEFSRGKFSTLYQLKYYEEVGRLLTKHNIWLSFKVYTSSVIYYSGVFIFAFGITGIIGYFFYKSKPINFYLGLILLVPYPVSVLLLYLGQVIIELPNTEPAGYFNSRYGLYVFPGLCFYIALFFIQYKNLKMNYRKIIFISFTIIILFQNIIAFSSISKYVPAIAEVKSTFSQPSVNLSSYLKENYDGGNILYDNVVFALYPWAKIDLRDRITFHTLVTGEKAMQDPRPYAKWIMFYTKASNDKIYNALKDNSNFRNYYNLMFEEYGIEVYKRK